MKTPWLELMILLASVVAVHLVLRRFVGVMNPKQSSDETENPAEQ